MARAGLLTQAEMSRLLRVSPQTVGRAIANEHRDDLSIDRHFVNEDFIKNFRRRARAIENYIVDDSDLLYSSDEEMSDSDDDYYVYEPSEEDHTSDKSSNSAESDPDDLTVCDDASHQNGCTCREQEVQGSSSGNIQSELIDTDLDEVLRRRRFQNKVVFVLIDGRHA
ncbi:hypothetical protein BDQ17DRAFT_1425970 [Cyathus striatus]|nr:hypothetical protein BDQ17DRAFT_1425970 [Cyathus striatus]